MKMPPRKQILSVTRHNRRRAERTTHLSVVELHDGDEFVIQGVGQLIDFSTLGICFSSRRVYTTGDRIQANVRLPHKAGVSITGRIVRVEIRSDVNRYGVEFNEAPKPTGF